MKLLHDGWKIKWFDTDGYDDCRVAAPGYDDSGWITAEVPGDIHTALIKAGIIKDPYYSLNDTECRWVPEKIWWYRCKFSHDSAHRKDEQAELIFEGLDTYAAIYLNGKEIGRHDNMFIPVSLNITGALQDGENCLAVKFTPVSEDTRKRDFGNMWLEMNTDRVFTRKSSTNFGWDWGPVIPTVGIWNNVSLKTYRQARLDNVYLKTVEITEEYAEILIEANVKCIEPVSELGVTVVLSDGNKKHAVILAVAENVAKGSIRVEKPRLWWTHDMGEPFLYEAEASLCLNEEILDKYRGRFGIRTVSVEMKAENGGSRFTFTLNKTGIFAKGANWIPADNLIGSIRDEKYIDLLSMARDANMNMIRVWGGGVYEKEIFYDTCDNLGILVWQDFMFACSSYPDYDDGFMGKVKNEIEIIVKRLRNHPSIAIWCGSNETHWNHSQKMFRLSDIRHYGEKIYSELIPSVLEKLDGSRLYWPGSPYGGNDPNSDLEGDKHNWQVWAGMVYPHRAGEKQLIDLSPEGVSFKRYAEDMGRFCSEFGMHASPVKETLRRNIPEKELKLGSFDMDYRNKDITPLRGKMLLESYTGQPRNLDEYIDFSMLCQAEGLKYGVEHFRRRMPECSGALIWQLNDCWPGTSWSLIDYYHFPKASYYYAKRFFAPVLLSFKEEPGDCVSLWVTNDTAQEYSDALTVGIQNFFGIDIFKETVEVRVKPGSSKMIRKYSLSGPEIIMFQRRWNFMYVKSRKNDACRNVYLFTDHKDVCLPEPSLDIVFNKSDNDIKINIKTDKFARFIKIECPADGTIMSDNYFDMLPGESKEILVVNKKGLKISSEDLGISCLHN